MEITMQASRGRKEGRVGARSKVRQGRCRLQTEDSREVTAGKEGMSWRVGKEGTKAKFKKR